MAVPKKKTSVSRKGMRRAGHTHKMKANSAVYCSNCGATTLQHRVCTSCGFYKGQSVMTIKVKADKSEAEESVEPEA